MKKSVLFKQRLFRGHIAVGIVFSLLMYISVFFGIFAIFRFYIDVWERPSRHFPAIDITEIDYAPMIDAVLSDPDFPKGNLIVGLPGYRKDPALRIAHQFSAEIPFNPVTRERLDDEGKSTELGMFLNGMHYGKPLKKLGYLIFGFTAVGVMFLVVGGVMLLFVGRFNDSCRNPQSFFSKWHRKIFTWSFPFFTLIVVCGTVMCLNFDGAGPMAFITTKGAISNIRPVIGPVLFPEDKPIERANITIPMLPVKELIKKAQTINPRVNFNRLILINWKDETARIQLEGYNPHRPFLNGISNRPTIVLNAGDGSLIRQTKVHDRPWAVLLTDFVYFLHLLFGVGPVIRLLTFLLMVACCFGLGFGVMIWLEKKARKFGKVPIYHWMGKFSLAVMIGVIPATGLLFVLQWLLPFELRDRLIWQQGAFFNLWLAALTWSFYRINSYQAAKEFLALGGLFYLFAPLLHFIRSGFGPLELITQGLWNILSVDFGLALFGVLFILSAYKLPADRDKAKVFWTKNQKRLKQSA